MYNCLKCYSLFEKGMKFCQKSSFSRMIAIIISFILVAAQLGSAQTQSSAPLFEQRIALFNYDNTTDLGIQDIGSEKHGTVTIRDLTFVGIPGKDPVKAYLVVPEGAGPFAGILWGHWLGHHKSNRSQYLDEAVTLASKGVVSILINAMWATPS